MSTARQRLMDVKVAAVERNSRQGKIMHGKTRGRYVLHKLRREGREAASLAAVDTDPNLPSLGEFDCERWGIAGLCGIGSCGAYAAGKCPIEDEMEG